MADDEHMEKNEIREKLREITSLESGLVGLMRTMSSGPLLSALVQARQVEAALADEEHWPKVHLLALGVELRDAQEEAREATDALEDLIVEAVYMQQACRCADCQRDKASLN